jgi:DNA (cytosine-5)-methyltransferase 1
MILVYHVCMPTMMDLFSGCGGMSLGFHMAGYRSLCAMDLSLSALATYAANGLGMPWRVSVTVDHVRCAVDRYGMPDVIVGGPPCQGFSTIGKRQAGDARNSLVGVFADVIADLRPRAAVMENVSGFLSMDGGWHHQRLVSALTRAGYRLHACLMLASRYGVPQRRRRFVMVAMRSDMPRPFRFPDQQRPMSYHEDPDDSDLRPWTLWDAISDLPPISAGGSGNTYLHAPKNDIQAWYRSRLPRLTHHHAASHTTHLLEMMTYIPEGGSAWDHDVRDRMPARCRPTSGFGNTYARLRAAEPCPTITRNFSTPSSSRCIHPYQHRALSIREAARVQSFPDHFTFLGDFNDQRLMIGNAVPPRYAHVLASALRRALSA